MANAFNSPWNDARRATLRRLLRLGVRPTTIAERFGFSRGSICGMMKRMGLSKPRPNGDDPKVVAAQRERDKLRKREKRAVNRASLGVGPQVQKISRRPEPRFKIEDFVARSADIEPMRLSLDELGKDECRYPFDATAAEKERLGGSFVFCGHPTPEGISYCPQHAALCYLPAKARTSGWRAVA